MGKRYKGVTLALAGTAALLVWAESLRPDPPVQTQAAPTIAVRTATRTPTATQAATLEVNVYESVNAALAGEVSKLEGVESVNLVSTLGGIVYLEMYVIPGTMSTDTADVVQETIKANLGDFEAREISFLMDDGDLAAEYRYDERAREWDVTVLMSLVRTRRAEAARATPTPAATRSTGVNCPQTCATAVALGWGAARIARDCPDLDADSDQVACYGD